MKFFHCKDSEYRPVAEPMWGSETCVIENRETIKRLSATAAGLVASGLLEVDVGEDWGSGLVSGEDVRSSNERSSFHSLSPPECTQTQLRLVIVINL